MSDSLKMVFAGLVGGLVVSLLLCSVLALKKPYALSVGKVDMQGILRAEARLLSDRKLSLPEEQEAMKQVMGRLRKILSSWPEKRLLLDSSAVISLHVDDYTTEIRQQLKQEEGSRK